MPLILPSNAPAEEATDKTAVEQIVREYLLANPEIIVEAMAVLRERERVAEATQSKQSINDHYESLARSPDDPVAGDPDGDVVIVEFFDYRCPYCKRVVEPLMKAVEDDGNIRLVFKEYPILGPESAFAARAALAANRQGKYAELHVALMSGEGQLTEANVFKIAKSVGLDTDRLRSDMDDPEIERQIAANYALANILGIKGTPAFVIGRELVPGAIDIQRMKRYVDQARGES
jgi:protein-disulfide isomerase